MCGSVKQSTDTEDSNMSKKEEGGCYIGCMGCFVSLFGLICVIFLINAIISDATVGPYNISIDLFPAKLTITEVDN